MAFTLYDPTIHSLDSLVQAVITAGTGVTVVPGTIGIRYGTIYDYYGEQSEATSVSFYDGSLPLNIGSGLLLTSGDGSPALTNTSSSYGGAFQDSSLSGDALDPQLQAIANAAFSGAGQIRDASILSFQIQISDPNVQSVRFDLVFGSDEYPEFSNTSFVDIGAAFINDVNYALFNNDAAQPLSVIKTNLDLGNFYDNQTEVFPIEYDGVSKLLTVIAPVQQGTNNIKIAVADTGDQAYDSGLFISNFQGTGYTGGGLAQVIDVTSGSLTQPLTVAAGNIVYQIPDTIEELTVLFSPSTTGDKTIISGAGNYLQAFFDFSAQSLLNAFYDSFNELNQTNSLTLVTPYGQQSLVGADLVLFNDAAFALDTLAGGKTWQAYALIKAAFGTGPDQTLLSQWVKAAQDVGSITELASEFLDTYAPVGFTSQDLVGHLLQVLSGAVPTQEAITNALSFLTTEGYDTSEEILAYVAENIVDMSGVEGSILALDLGFFI